MSKDFYAKPNNLGDVLVHFLSIFSEGRRPTVPWKRVGGVGGDIDVAATLALPCYAEFPASERAKWLAAHPGKER